jgi:hypothetical protein
MRCVDQANGLDTPVVVKPLPVSERGGDGRREGVRERSIARNGFVWGKELLTHEHTDAPRLRPARNRLFLSLMVPREVDESPGGKGTGYRAFYAQTTGDQSSCSELSHTDV